jgi:hypothetical protein
MMVVAVMCGSIDPSASNFSLLIKPTIYWCISSIQGVFVGLSVSWTQDVTYGRCGQTYPWPTVADPGRLRPAMASCGRLWPAAVGYGAPEPGYVWPALHHCFGAAL